MESINPNFDDSQFFDELNEHAKAMAANESPNLQLILSTSEKLKKLKESEIRFSAPILQHGENAVIFPNTINFIQGQAGVHKSRLAESICSALLKTHNCTNQLLGFERTNFEQSHTVVYVDTERNLTEQLPFALQSIQTKAGYERDEHPQNFKYISLLEIARKERFSALNEYLSKLRESTKTPLFIVLDVMTDCIEDFNRVDKSMELIDLMNVTINKFNAVFLCLIHENPKSDKARGHAGTEGMNKASTVLQVGFEKDSFNNDTDLIRVKYLKCRSTKRHEPFYMVYSDQEKGLVLADASTVSNVFNNRKQKAFIEDITEFIEMQIGDGSKILRRDLIDFLTKEFNVKDRTIENRLKEVIEQDMELFNNEGHNCRLKKELIEKNVLYYLETRE